MEHQRRGPASGSAPRPDRRANRSLLRRTIFLMVVFGVALFIPMVIQLFRLQIVENESWKTRAAGQQTNDVKVEANRGTIYDAAGNTLAISATVYNLILAPRDVAASINPEGKEYQTADGEVDQAKVDAAVHAKRKLIVDGLVEMLGMDEQQLWKRLEKTGSAYEILRYYMDEESTLAVRQFIDENKLSGMLYFTPTAQRYYPYSSIASHLLGYMGYTEESGSEQVGKDGVERRYEELLSGVSGRVVTAKNGAGTQMLSSYEAYMDAEDGYDLTLSVDASIQSLLEQTLAEGIEAYDVQKGGFAIAMDPNTGAVLGMASSPDYDPNHFDTLLSQDGRERLAAAREEYGEDSDEYAQIVRDELNLQWRNKALADTYEPGSTFKALVVAEALEEGVVNLRDTFYCGGSSEVGGWTIHCHKKVGHGAQTLTQAVENSCNVALMEIGERLGSQRFWQYLEDYGLFDRTGIDLSGEGNSQFWAEEDFKGPYGAASLAVGSFGQTFKVTPIQMITAFACVINGGHLLTPYVVESAADSAGNTVYHHQTQEIRQVLSESTSRQLRDILESVVANGTGSNAYMAGYRIAGKTGTSEKRDEEGDDVIVSFMGFAPADDPQVLVLLAYDSPKRKTPGSHYTASGTYISGGNIAAPMCGQLIAEILDYLGVEKQYTADELSAADVTVPALAGLDLAAAQKEVEKAGLKARVEGDGAAVTGQIPTAGLSIPGGSTVILYMGAQVPDNRVEVPDTYGMTAAQAKTALEERGLFMRATGVSKDYDDMIVAADQSIDPGSMVARGTVVEVRFVDNSVIDYGYEQ